MKHFSLRMALCGSLCFVAPAAAQTPTLAGITSGPAWPIELAVIDPADAFPPEERARFDGCLDEALAGSARRHDGELIDRVTTGPRLYVEVLLMPGDGRLELTVSMATAAEGSDGRMRLTRLADGVASPADDVASTCIAVRDLVSTLVDSAFATK